MSKTYGGVFFLYVVFPNRTLSTTRIPTGTSSNDGMSASDRTLNNQSGGIFEDDDDEGWVSEGELDDPPMSDSDANQPWDERPADQNIGRDLPADELLRSGELNSEAQQGQMEGAERRNGELRPEAFGEAEEGPGLAGEEGEGEGDDDNGEAPHAFRSWSIGQVGGAGETHQQLLLRQQRTEEVRDGELDEEGQLIPQLEVVHEVDEEEDQSSSDDDGAEHVGERKTPSYSHPAVGHQQDHYESRQMIHVPNTGTFTAGVNGSVDAGGGKAEVPSPQANSLSCDEFIVQR